MLSLAKTAAHQFFELSNPEDEFFLLTVSSNPRTLTGPVGDAHKIEDLVRSAGVGGDTSLYDTIVLGLSQARQQRKARRALLVISDGMDNHSRCSKAELLRTVVESDVQVYTISLDSPRAVAKGIPMAEVQSGLTFMKDLAAKSGGLSAHIRQYDNSSAAIAKISNAIRSQYVIGYPGLEGDSSAKWHRVQIKVNLSKVNVYSRSGYQSH
jgi:VWFA-related protein